MKEGRGSFSLLKKILFSYGLIVVLFFISCAFIIWMNINVTEKAEDSQDISLPSALMAKDMSIHIIQVQQWLTDISATKAQPGYDDGFNEAEKHAQEFKKIIKWYRETFKSNTNILKELDELDTAFNDYYEMGKKMANEYIAKGTEAGNLFMEKFDPFAAELAEKSDLFVEKQTAILNADMTDITSTSKKQTMLIIISSSFALIIAVLLSIVLSRNIINPVTKVRDLLINISQGDLRNRITVNNKDELGEMVNYVNTTTDNLAALLLIIKNKSNILSNIGTDLSSNMIETSTAIRQIISNIEAIKNRVINQAASVTETNATMEQISAAIERLDMYIEKQTVNVAQSSSAIEEMLSNILSVTQTLVKNSESIDKLTSAAGAGRIDLSKAVDDIKTVAQESESLLEISAVIQNIASQTNLLSMNAAIEAAHAGESGKGFAVVADEIRKLAEMSGSQSKTISTVLKKMKNSIDGITKDTSTVLAQFETIENDVKIVANQELIIRNAMEEQTSGSKQILEAVTQLNDVTQKVKAGSSEMLIGSKGIISEGQHLNETTKEITQMMNEISSGTREITQSVQNVSGLSVQTKDNIDTLAAEVSKFKLE